MMVSQAAEAGWRSSLLVRRARLAAAGNWAENSQHQIEKGLELKELPRLLLDMEKEDSFELYMLEITFLVSLMVSTDRSDVIVLKNSFCTLGSHILLSEFGLRPEKTLWEGPYDPCSVRHKTLEVRNPENSIQYNIMSRKTKKTFSEFMRIRTLTKWFCVHLVPLRGWIAILSEKQRGPGISGAVTGADLFSR